MIGRLLELAGLTGWFAFWTPRLMAWSDRRAQARWETRYVSDDFFRTMGPRP